MSLTAMDPAERHRAVSAGFADVVRQVRDWDAPAPVAGWTARDVVDHLVTWFPGFLAGGGVPLPSGPSETCAAWAHQTAAVQGLLDDPAVAGSSFALPPHIPAQPLAQAIDAFYVSDVFMHTWDLARAGGLDVELDPDTCEQLLSGMVGMEQVLRGSGQYGPAVPVADDADAQTRLIAFIGRDPAWTPTA